MDDKTEEIVIQGWRADRALLEQCTESGPIPETEAVVRMPVSFVVSDHETVADVIAEFERASNRARAIAADIDLDATRQRPDFGAVGLRWICLLMIQEFARHAGHSDILREQTGATRRT